MYMKNVTMNDENMKFVVLSTYMRGDQEWEREQ